MISTTTAGWGRMLLSSHHATRQIGCDMSLTASHYTLFDGGGVRMARTETLTSLDGLWRWWLIRDLWPGYQLGQTDQPPPVEYWTKISFTIRENVQTNTPSSVNVNSTNQCNAWCRWWWWWWWGGWWWWWAGLVLWSSPDAQCSSKLAVIDIKVGSGAMTIQLWCD